MKPPILVQMKSCMKKLLFVALLSPLFLLAQKKPIDHSVYDSWESLGERVLSNNGKWVAYTINLQEGDGRMVLQSSDGKSTLEVPRGYTARFSEDNNYLVFKIRPKFQDTREARIKKRRPDDMPKDSIGWISLQDLKITKVARVKTYKMPEKSGNWLAYHLEKALPAAPVRTTPDSATQVRQMLQMADSLLKVADSIRNKVVQVQTSGMASLRAGAGNNRPTNAAPQPDPVEEGTELVLLNTSTGKEWRFPLASEYYFSQNGNSLIVETTRKNGAANSVAAVIWVDLNKATTDTIFKKFNDAKSYAMDESGTQLVFVAERDSSAKALRKFYQVWYYQQGMKEAEKVIHQTTSGIPANHTISDNFFNRFSKDGKKVFFGIAPIRPIKDTSLVDFETARLDIWHYQDEQNQPQQLLQLNNELRRSFMAVWQPKTSKVVMLGAEDAENVQLVQEGDADFVLATSSKGNRIASQWQGFAKSRAFLIDIATGQRTPVNGDIRGNYSASPDGKFIAWYDWEKKNYFTYEIASKKVTNVSQSLKVTVWDEDDDHPDDPPPHGVAGWAEGDEAMMIYDKFDIWQLDPKGQKTPINITKGIGRKNQVTFRQISFDREKRFVSVGDVVGISIFDHKEKGYAMQLHSVGAQFNWDAKQNPTRPMNISTPIKANDAMVFSYVTSQPNVSPTVTIITAIDSSVDASGKQYRMGTATTLSKLNPQQENYNWFTVELHKWKMFDGKMSEGLLFKPENFDSTKKYPVIFYFYEKNADTRYNYRVPAPSASTINIPYFTSNGYLVFDPNIYYKTGQPGEDAYNAIVSAARYLSKMKWVDSNKMAIQGQSWGGYQVSYLVTRTNMFAAAGAGAPVSNMTSAYGGVRWGSGLIRQFQYERSQSRIGATLWQKPDLYIKNSPLFKADKVKTPLLIMHNDKDDAVPWYQGIEYFTALKRLGKPVWMLQYNDEVHNLAERRNRKDLSIRLAQFFDHYLKGAPMPVWMKSGVPATLKGIDWGLGY